MMALGAAGVFRWFVDSTIGRLILALLVLIAWTAYHRNDAAKKAAAEAKAACQEEQLRKTVTEVTRQLDASRKAVEMQNERSITRAKHMREMERDINDLDQQVKDLTGACSIPDPVLKRVRNIR